MSPHEQPRVVGPYALYGEIARGGMATVYYGRLRGAAGFARTVAIKRLHAEATHDAKLRAMLEDEARLASRVRHPNVVSIVDVVAHGEELLLVLEYVHGESLARLLEAARERGERVAPAIAAAIAVGALRGLHAAHEAKDDKGASLDLVHRDISPHNVMVDEHGVARVLDFGVAKARGRAAVTEAGGLKGKVGYMAPEQVHGKATRASDLFAMGIVLWEALVGERLFDGATRGEVLAAVLSARAPRPSARGVELPAALEDALMKSLARAPDKRFASAREMASALEASCALAGPLEIAQWVARLAGDALGAREQVIAAIERDARAAEAGGAAARAADGARERTGRARSRAARAGIALGIAAGAVALGAALFGPRGGAAGGAEPARGAASAAASAPRAGGADDGADDGERARAAASEAPVAPSTGEPAGEGAPSEPASSASSASSARPRAVPARPASAGAARDCVPPYTVDRSGRKTWKRECF